MHGDLRFKMHGDLQFEMHENLQFKMHGDLHFECAGIQSHLQMCRPDKMSPVIWI